MTFKENHLPITKTARYFTFGKLTETTRNIWFVCHGYGQLAQSCLKRFAHLDPDENYIVAPEGLSRFYWNGFGGKPVASWMTAEGRDHEIKDYVAYLDTLYQKIMAQNTNPQAIINVLGFSQGAATASRWVGLGQARPHNLIFWAGMIAHDLDFPSLQPIFEQSNIWCCLGDADPFIKPATLEKVTAIFETQSIDCQILNFKGKHDIPQEALTQLIEKMEA